MRSAAWMTVLASCLFFACGDDGESASSNLQANLVVRQRVAALAPAAGFAHRGHGPTAFGNPLPENSLPAFRDAIAAGTDGLEMDSELSEDGQLILMHDDTVDRTTSCTGCVSNLSFAALRQCHLLNGDGQATQEVPPTLDEVFQLQPSSVLVNVELKIFGATCLTPGHGPVDLATAMVKSLRRLGVERRTLVQSFDADALASVKAQAPDIYTAYLVSGLRARDIATALEIHADAIQPGGAFPFLALDADLIRSAREAGLQVIVWTVDDAASMNTLIDVGVDGMITDDIRLLKQVVQSEQG